MPSVRPFVAVGLWLGLTASATAIVWAGTSTVAANLTDRPAPVVAHGDVVTALESGAPELAETTPGITAPGAGAPPPNVQSDDSGSTPPSANELASGPSASDSPEPEEAAPPPPETPAPVDPGTPPTTQPPPTGPSETYSTPGGTVTVACENNFFIRLVSASPNPGYETRVGSAGPYTVEVSFVRSGFGSFVSAFCMGQPVRAYSGVGMPNFGMGG
jgi:hypothetical protein